MFLPDSFVLSFFTEYFSAHVELTNFMDLSTSWEAANCAATQEIPCNLWNLKVHYRVHESPSNHHC
jgi:hypothetical protein